MVLQKRKWITFYYKSKAKIIVRLAFFDIIFLNFTDLRAEIRVLQFTKEEFTGISEHLKILCSLIYNFILWIRRPFVGVHNLI